LSFWSRLSKRTSLPATEHAEDDEPNSPSEGQELLDKVMSRNEEPAKVLDSILAATAPPPPSVEGKQSELEDKIIRECVKEFSKGGMYFAYTFGK
jgi:hypothetical protein